jgi:hypothetical protein
VLAGAKEAVVCLTDKIDTMIEKAKAHIRAKDLDTDTIMLLCELIELSVQMVIALAAARGEITIKKGEVDHG